MIITDVITKYRYERNITGYDSKVFCCGNNNWPPSDRLNHVVKTTSSVEGYNSYEGPSSGLRHFQLDMRDKVHGKIRFTTSSPRI